MMSSTTHTIRASVEEQVIVMGRVVVRAQHAIEKSARTVARLSQERGFSLRALPIAGDANPPAIRKHEASHIPGFGTTIHS